MGYVPDGSVDLVVTSPPYPIIEMWDDYDNDDKWAKKCFHTACRMMRKPQRRKFGWRR